MTHAQPVQTNPLYTSDQFAAAIDRYLTIVAQHPWILGEHTGSPPLTVIADREAMLAFAHTRGEKLGVIYQDRYITLIRDLVENADGARFPYLRLFNTARLQRGAYGVAMLPIYDGRVVLVNIFRHALRQWRLEIPRGFGEPDMNAEAVVANELAEEIGAVAETVQPLGILHNNSGMEANAVQLFFVQLAAMDTTRTDGEADGIRLVNIGEFERMMATGVITDAFTISTYAQAKLRGLL